MKEKTVVKEMNPIKGMGKAQSKDRPTAKKGKEQGLET